MAHHLNSIYAITCYGYTQYSDIKHYPTQAKMGFSGFASTGKGLMGGGVFRV